MSRPTRGAVDALLALVRERTGLSLPEPQRQHVLAAVQRAMHAARVDDPARYLALVQRDAAAMDALLEELTVGETYFFREPAQWDFLRSHVMPRLLARGPTSRPIRAWSAACASGEEAYSLAIVFHQLGLEREARVLGTDISRQRLAAARRGRFRKWSMRGMSPSVIARFFRRSGDVYDIDPEVRARVEFRHHNLADPEAPFPTVAGGFDLILCRNVLIYFDAETTLRVARRLMDALSDDGWLFLAASDPFLARLVECETVVVPSGVAYRKRRAVAAALPPEPAQPRESPPPGPARPPPRQERAAPARRPASAGSAPALSRRARPVGPDALDELQRLYRERDYAAAAELAAEVTARDAGWIDAWVVRVRALANQGRLHEAGAACAAALEQHPVVPELVYLHALLLSEGGYAEQATAAARRALYLDPGLAVAHLLLGDLQRRAGEPVAARRSFATAERLLLRMGPDEPVPASDGESPARLLQAARTQLATLDQERTR